MTAPINNLSVLKSLPEWWSLKVSSYREKGDFIMPDEIVKRSGYWYAKERKFEGTLIKYQSLKTANEDEARQHLFEIKMLIRQGVYQKFHIKFDKLEKEYDPKVDRKNKLRNLKVHLVPEFAGKRLSEIDSQEWAERIASTKPEATALAILRVGRELGLEIEYKALTFIPGETFDGSQIVSEELALAVIAELKKGPRSKKYASLCEVAMHSTLPLSDLLHLRKKDVRFSGSLDHGITYARRKTRYKNRPALFVPMTDKLRKAFDGIPTPLAEDGRWFPDWKADAVSNTVGRAFKKLGWPRGAMHQFRHFGACYLIREGVPLTTIQELMGHGDFNTTLIYARVDREKLIEGVKKFDHA